MNFGLSPVRPLFALAFGASALLVTSAAFADDEIPAPRPPPPPVVEPPPNTSPPQVAAGEDGTTPKYVDNALFVELGGPAILYSLNYDRRLGDYFSFRVGASYLGLSSGRTDLSVVLVPMTFNALIGGRSYSHFELGIGAMPAFGNTSSSTSNFSGAGIAGLGVIGYRLQPPDSGFFFRGNINIIVAGGFAIPWPGVSFGASF